MSEYLLAERQPRYCLVSKASQKYTQELVLAQLLNGRGRRFKQLELSKQKRYCMNFKPIFSASVILDSHFDKKT